MSDVSLPYVHVDVFSSRPYGGNSLAVFPDARGITGDQMLRITQELRHFETIFLEPVRADGTVPARVFDLEEELPFAGHPIIGAAGVLHRALKGKDTPVHRFTLGNRVVEVRTEASASDGKSIRGTLDQGRPVFGAEVTNRSGIATALSLDKDDLDATLPLLVVSTGLRYLVVPVKPDVLSRVRITTDLEPLLAPHEADYAVLLDDTACEVRHWVNDGTLEDVATGSAAGCIGAYRLHNGHACPGQTFSLAQGRFAGRPSVLEVTPYGTPVDVEHVTVGGDVAFVGSGVLERLP
jgi:PhzF family phenazine biosynthesis protein